MTDSKYLREKTPQPEDFVDLDGPKIQHQQIFSVVKSFYIEVAKDERLSVAFSGVSDWEHHFEIMTNFWWSRLGGPGYIYYPYNPFKKHFENGFNAELLSRWLELFKIALNKNLNQEQSEAWFLIAEAIGRNLLLKNNEIIRMLNSR